MFDDKVIISMKQNNKTWREIADHFGVEYETLRNYVRKPENKEWYDTIKQENPRGDVVSETKTKLKDGSISASIKKRLRKKKTFTEVQLLQLHGFDPKEFQIKTVVSNEWSMTNGGGDKYYNFQSKIIVEPKKLEDKTLDIIEKILENIKPFECERNLLKNSSNYLLIPLYDIHFGLNGYEDYRDYLVEIISIMNKSYKEILIIVGGDFLDVDNFNNTTVKGTVIDTVDFEKMITDAEKFLFTLCVEALKFSSNVKLTYLPGNHASSNDYLLVRAITMLLPQLQANVDIEEYKHDWLGNHSIFSHHGDKRKASNKLLEVLVSKYAKEWGYSTSRYLITGHLHHESSLSNAGMTHYQVMSPSKSTSYEKKQGYISSEKGIQLFEFDETKRKAVYYL